MEDGYLMSKAEFPTLAGLVAAHHRVERWDGDWVCGFVDCNVSGESAEDYAAHVQDEWVKARTIERVEQLAALPMGSVIVDSSSPQEAFKLRGLWWCPTGPGPSDDPTLPVLLLRHPEIDR